MTAADHVGLADELIDAARCLRMVAKPLVPGRKPVALEIGKWPAVDRDDELVHVRMIEIAADERILLVRISPPADTSGVCSQRRIIGKSARVIARKA